MRRLILLVLITLVLAAVLHFATIITIPYVAAQGGWSRVAEAVDEPGIAVLPAASPENSVLPLMDPAIAYAVCRFDLSERPFAITAVLPPSYWSVAFHTPQGTVFYAVNYEAAIDQELGIELRNGDQARQLRLDQADHQQRLYVTSPADTGFALFRAFAANRAERSAIEGALRQTSCARIEPVPVSEGSSIPIPRSRPEPAR